ncbi:MAG: hypothetical protein HRU17_01200 [Polyangiaceae bacterium]|nr:hypothetical protein [Polyangiaceae bacterium]
MFVDTAGRTPQDDELKERLAECLSQVDDIHQEVLLVLPAWLRARDASRVVASYEEPRLTGIVLRFWSTTCHSRTSATAHECLKTFTTRP